MSTSITAKPFDRKSVPLRWYASSFHVSMPAQSITTGGLSTARGRST